MATTLTKPRPASTPMARLGDFVRRGEGTIGRLGGALHDLRGISRAVQQQRQRAKRCPPKERPEKP
ncbi:MAG: hypothetical protein WBO08_06515 [Mycobacterium sp.]